VQPQALCSCHCTQLPTTQPALLHSCLTPAARHMHAHDKRHAIPSSATNRAAVSRPLPGSCSPTGPVSEQPPGRGLDTAALLARRQGSRAAMSRQAARCIIPQGGCLGVLPGSVQLPLHHPAVSSSSTQLWCAVQNHTAPPPPPPHTHTNIHASQPCCQTQRKACQAAAQPLLPAPVACGHGHPAVKVNRRPHHRPRNTMHTPPCSSR
jgi:hypothetical protein